MFRIKANCQLGLRSEVRVRVRVTAPIGFGLMCGSGFVLRVKIRMWV